MFCLLMFVVLFQKALLTIGQTANQTSENFLLKEFPSIYSRKFIEYKTSQKNLPMPGKVFTYSIYQYAGDGEAKDGNIFEISAFIMKGLDRVKEVSGVSFTYKFEVPRLSFKYKLVVMGGLGNVRSTVVMKLNKVMISVYSVAKPQTGWCSLDYPFARVNLTPGEYDYELEDVDYDNFYQWPVIKAAKPLIRTNVWRYMKDKDGTLLKTIESLISKALIGPAVADPWDMALKEAKDRHLHDLCQEISSYGSNYD